MEISNFVRFFIKVFELLFLFLIVYAWVLFMHKMVKLIMIAVSVAAIKTCFDTTFDALQNKQQNPLFRSISKNIPNIHVADYPCVWFWKKRKKKVVPAIR